LLFDAVVGEEQSRSSSWQQQQQQQHVDEAISDHQHSIQRRSIRKTATLGGSAVLECDIPYPPSAASPLQTGHGHVGGAEHMIKWHKQGVEVPIFIQLNRLPAHIDANYQGRIRLLDHASVEISGVRASDEGWYECSVVFLQRTDDSNPNGTWVYLAVTGLQFDISLFYMCAPTSQASFSTRSGVILICPVLEHCWLGHLIRENPSPR